ncbi:MAG: sigma-70 family RNA polymerase sigma factor [Candidatus Methylomirabilis sp.]|nr:sigma-70 family RNA polymerase sigma factor [Deltaproteobacteria bacterium]
MRPDDAPDDRTLLAGVAQGEKAAFHALYERYARRATAAVGRQVGDPETVREIVQEVFLAVWQGARNYDGARGEPEFWIHAIVRNKVHDHWRRLARVGADAGIDPEALRDGRDPRLVDWRLSLEKALRMLTPDQGQAIEMIYFQGRTFSETAAELGIPLGTLKSRVHMALGSLRAVLDGRERRR